MLVPKDTCVVDSVEQEFFTTMESAKFAVKNDEFAMIVGPFLVKIDIDEFAASVSMIEGCRFTLHQIANVILPHFPTGSGVVVVSNEPYMFCPHVSIAWSEMEYVWNDHDAEVEKRIIVPLKELQK